MSVASRQAGPVNEIGVVNPWAVQQIPGLGKGSWAQIEEDAEHVPDLVWPRSIEVYRRMAHHPQIAGLTRATINPIRRYHWSLSIGDADEKLARKLADDLDLPIEGEPYVERIRSQGKFVWSDFVRLMLLAPTRYGHAFFEQAGYIDKDGDFRYAKLAERPQKTIQRIVAAADGGLIFIQQWTKGEPIIPVERLVAGVWEQENGSWTGVPMLRDLYVPWLMIDRLNRVDLAKHERNSMGVPFVMLPEGAGPKEEQTALALVRQYRAGGGSGGVLPAGMDLVLKGVEGGTSDPLASIQHAEQLMSRSWLAMLMELGQTRTGSRALGQTFVDFFSLGLDCIADWLRGLVQAYVIEDYFDWNRGQEAKAPRLKYAPLEADLSVADFAALVKSGALQVDDALEEDLRQRYNLPERTSPRVQVQVPGAFGSNTNGAGSAAEAGRAQTDPGGAQVAAMSSTSTTRKGLRVVTLRTRPEHRHVAATAEDPRLRREMQQFELSAAFDPGRLDDVYQLALAQAITEISTGRPAQVDQLGELVAAASTNAQLGRITPDVQAPERLAAVLQSAAAAGAQLAAAEALAQGQSIAVELPSDIVRFSADRSRAVHSMLADFLAQSARGKALGLTRKGGDSEIAAAVTQHLGSLSDSWLRDQLGGAVTAAINDGRHAVFAAGPVPSEIIASEILDQHCCEPCRSTDGKRYATMADAQRDYPTGGYRGCLGGIKCRGTLVVIYPT